MLPRLLTTTALNPDDVFQPPATPPATEAAPFDYEVLLGAVADLLFGSLLGVLVACVLAVGGLMVMAMAQSLSVSLIGIVPVLAAVALLVANFYNTSAAVDAGSVVTESTSAWAQSEYGMVDPFGVVDRTSVDGDSPSFTAEDAVFKTDAGLAVLDVEFRFVGDEPVLLNTATGVELPRSTGE